ncbi:serine hydrolase domain-containing protein [Streptomyces sp. GLT-R25]
MTDRAGGGPTRRQLGRGLTALGGALILAPLPAASAAPDADESNGDAHGHPTLRHGSAERAGLLPAHLRQLVTDAEAFLDPSPKYPWYAGALLLAGRGGTVALHHPIGKAVRYSAYDEKTDTAVEFPADQQIAMAKDTVFDLASVSKLFTSILAVQQIERGELELEGKVASYLPDFGGAGKQDITIRQLLTHTSGFRAWIPLYSAPTYEEKLQLIWKEAPLNPPGTRYLYSDLNLISLQLVLEKITGHALDALLRSEITDPLGMRRTRFNPPLPPGGRRPPPPRTPANRGRGSTAASYGARCTTRTRTASAVWRATPVSSPPHGTWRSSAGRSSTAVCTAGRGSWSPSPWS